MFKLLFLSLIILFIGCADNSDNPTAEVYLEEPTVEQNSDAIYVKFKTNINDATVHERTVYLLDKNDNLVNVDIKLLYYTNEIVLTPYSYLPIAEKYTLIVTTGVKDINDNHLKTNYVYRFTTMETVPVLSDLKASVAEDKEYGTTIGQIDIRTTGDNNILSINLSGVGSDVFQASVLGYISLAKNNTLDFETTTSYHLTAVATNSIGTSKPVIVDINVTNVAEIVPTLLESNATVAEDAQEGDYVGDVIIESSGDHYILSMDIDGTGSKNFTVSPTGEITVAPDADLDYETQDKYRLTVSAANGAGDSESVPLTIYISDVDNVATLDNFIGYVDENALGGVEVGKIKIISDGDNDISSINLSGDGSEKFTVSSDGTISVVDNVTLNYEEKNVYNLKAIAKNSAGDSPSVDIKIILNNIENPFLIAKISADDAQRDDHFGKSIAVSGDYVVVGASQEDSIKDNSGAVYLYKKDSKGVLSQIAKLKADDADEDDFFGYAVAIDGDYIVVGAYKKDLSDEEDAGKVYIFKRKSDDKDDVVQIATIKAKSPQEYAQFGDAVSISGRYIVVGASHENVETEDDAGAAYLFKRESDSLNDVSLISTLHASNYGKEDWFGYSVAIDGNYIVVGAYGEDTENTNAGASYLFKRDSDNTDDTSQIAMILIHNSRDYDYFGYSVDISGDYILIGAYGEDTTASGAGTAYLFKRESDDEDDITLLKTIQVKEPHTQDYFGKSVAIDDTYMVIGAYSENVDDHLDSGSAYLFRRDLNDDTDIIQLKQLTARDITDQEFFGRNVAISKDNVVVATQQEGKDVSSYVFDIEPLDQVYFYNKKITDYPEELTKKFVVDIDARSPRSEKISFKMGGTDGDLFNLEENSLYFNNIPDYEKPEDAGRDNSYNISVIATDEFDKEASLDMQLIIQNRYFLNASKIKEKNPYQDDAFAKSISISGDYVAVGVPYDDSSALGAGCAYLFKKNDDGTFQQIAKFEADDAQENDYFGQSISISGNYIVVGAYLEDTNGEDAGAAYLFKRKSDNQNDVRQIAKIVSDDTSDNDYFGYSVAIDGNYIVVGAYQNDTKGTDSGTAYLFRRESDSNNDYKQVAKLNADDEDDNDLFGYSVDISGNYIVVGAYKYEDENDDDDSSSDSSETDENDDSSGDDDSSGGDMENSDGETSSDSGSGDDSSGGMGGGSYYVQSFKKADSNEENDNINKGIVYLFKRETDTNNDTKQIAKFMPDDLKSYDYFGKSVAIDGDYIAVGAYSADVDDINNTGTAYLLKRESDDEDDIKQIAKLNANDANEEDWFGFHIDISGDYIAVGSYKNDVDTEDSGAVYVYKRESDNKNDVTQVEKISAYDDEKGDYFGYAVAIDNDKIAIGAFREDSVQEQSGSAYIYIKDSDEKE